MLSSFQEANNLTQAKKISSHFATVKQRQFYSGTLDFEVYILSERTVTEMAPFLPGWCLTLLILVEVSMIIG